MNPFDLWEGANFKLKIRNVEGYRNYDKSEFSSPEPLFDDDKTLERIWKQEHSLQAFVDPKNFKSYDALKERLNRVLGINTPTNSGNTKAASTDLEDDVQDPKPLKSKKATPVAELDDDLDIDAIMRKIQDDE